MKESILTLFGVCLLAGLTELLLPDDAAVGTRRALHFLCALAVLVVILTPFVRFLGSGDGLFSAQLQIEEGELADYEAIFAQVLEQQYEQDLHEGLSALLVNEYGIAAEDHEIRTDYAADGSLARICIYLRGAAITHNPEALERELAARFGCLVEVR